MNTVLRAVVLVLATLLLPTAAAALDMTLHNQIETQQIQNMLVYTEGGGRLSWNTATLPGGHARYKDNSATRMQRLVLDMGLVRYRFEDFTAVSGQEVLTLELRREGAGSAAVPVLTLREDPAVRLQGKAEDLLPKNNRPQHVPTFAHIAAAQSMREAAALAGGKPLNAKGQLLFTLSLGQLDWRATLAPRRPSEPFSNGYASEDAPTSKLDVLDLMAPHTAKNVRATLTALYALNYRPWSMGMSEGVDKKGVRRVQPHKEGMTLEQAKALTEKLLLAPGATAQQLLESSAMLVPEALYVQAASDAKILSPNACVIMNVNSTESMEVRWFVDCAALISFSR